MRDQLQESAVQEEAALPHLFSPRVKETLNLRGSCSMQKLIPIRSPNLAGARCSSPLKIATTNSANCCSSGEQTRKFRHRLAIQRFLRLQASAGSKASHMNGPRRKARKP